MLLVLTQVHVDIRRGACHDMWQVQVVSILSICKAVLIVTMSTY